MICINWDGFPQYAARCVRALVKALDGEQVIVVSRRPTVPIRGMEEICGCPVVWVDENERRSISDVCGGMPRYMCVSGWFLPLYNRWRDEVRMAGGRVSCACDNNYVLDALGPESHAFGIWAREQLRALRFKWYVKSKYDSFFVPGKSGRKLLRSYGVPNNMIYEGMYSADCTLFRPGPILSRRPRKILYVGQFIYRKNVVRLATSFMRANEKRDWALELYGTGGLRDDLLNLERQSHNTVHVHDFLQPEELAAKYREARLFCLPSLREHWGLVVHEAALSGCALLLGKYTGAAVDFLSDSAQGGVSLGSEGFANGLQFDPYSEESLYSAIRRGMDMSEAEMANAFSESVRLGEAHGIGLFVASILSMIREGQ